MKESFTFRRSFYEAIQSLESTEDQLKLFNAICELGLNGKIIELNGMLNTVMTLIAPRISQTPSQFELEHDQLFTEFWAAYPRKYSKSSAAREFHKIQPMNREILTKILRYLSITSSEWKDYSATIFLSNRKWETCFDNDEELKAWFKKVKDSIPIPNNRGDRGDRGDS